MEKWIQQQPVVFWKAANIGNCYWLLRDTQLILTLQLWIEEIGLLSIWKALVSNLMSKQNDNMLSRRRTISIPWFIEGYRLTSFQGGSLKEITLYSINRMGPIPWIHPFVFDVILAHTAIPVKFVSLSEYTLRLQQYALACNHPWF